MFCSKFSYISSITRRIHMNNQPDLHNAGLKFGGTRNTAV